MTAGRVDPADGATRVLVADDHPAFRAGLRALLETASDVVVVGRGGLRRGGRGRGALATTPTSC